jgi:hypothetical protein
MQSTEGNLGDAGTAGGKERVHRSFGRKKKSKRDATAD